MNILVLCTGNSARSILLECILSRLGGDTFAAFSAGSKPAGKVHPQSLSLLKAKGYDTSQLASKSWDVFAGSDAPRMDVVITVCGSAAGEACPLWPGTPLRAHWGVEDPANATQAEAPAAFETAYDILYRRAERFVDARLSGMDRAALQSHLNTCGAVK
ncbi:arsenate reductase ArsC [uncultured Sulfitobacter sp.]|uniref:arsenate reductase ArsC n=1 Tax=uncultured Sulfitobacter sp. TaxID=191468 RepID=UPI002616FEDD|nr:arsenate reductase ArsC [uncultured Sulfitobacter sp.]